MIEFNRESRARLHFAMLGAFENPTDAEKAYVEICSHSAFPADVFNLARAIEFNIYKKMFATDFQFTSVDASALEGEFESETVSWATRLADREQGKRLFDLLQAGDTLVVRWVDRLGRNYDDVKEVIETFNKKGVTVCTVINRMTFEADFKMTDPTMKAARNAILGFMAALAEADATAKREARQAGIAHAKNAADAEQKYRGKKPSYDRETFEAVQTMLTQDTFTISSIARETGLSRQAVLRIRDDTATADAALRRWGM